LNAEARRGGRRGKGFRIFRGSRPSATCKGESLRH
jgi:hypothetical protein